MCYTTQAHHQVFLFDQRNYSKSDWIVIRSTEPRHIKKPQPLMSVLRWDLMLLEVFSFVILFAEISQWIVLKNVLLEWTVARSAKIFSLKKWLNLPRLPGKLVLKIDSFVQRINWNVYLNISLLKTPIKSKVKTHLGSSYYNENKQIHFSFKCMWKSPHLSLQCSLSQWLLACLYWPVSCFLLSCQLSGQTKRTPPVMQRERGIYGSGWNPWRPRGRSPPPCTPRTPSNLPTTPFKGVPQQPLCQQAAKRRRAESQAHTYPKLSLTHQWHSCLNHTSTVIYVFVHA